MGKYLHMYLLHICMSYVKYSLQEIFYARTYTHAHMHAYTRNMILVYSVCPGVNYTLSLDINHCIFSSNLLLVKDFLILSSSSLEMNSVNDSLTME